MIIRAEIIGITNTALRLYRDCKELGIRIKYIDTETGNYRLIFQDILHKESEIINFNCNRLIKIIKEVSKNSSYCEIMLSCVIALGVNHDRLKRSIKNALYSVCKGKCIKGDNEVRCIYKDSYTLLITSRRRGITISVLANTNIQTPNTVVTMKGLKCREEESLRLALHELLGFLISLWEKVGNRG